MAFWLLKTEPEEYSYFDLEQSRGDTWEGVKNFAAQRNLKNMQPGDLAFIYHTGREKSITGVAEIVTPPYPDPENNKLYVVEVAPRYRLNLPVSLHEIKQDPGFSGWELVRLPRLSVMPVSEEHWLSVHKMAGEENRVT
ncbi:MAG: EVE domain-containing protein [Bacillota bacterium]